MLPPRTPGAGGLVLQLRQREAKIGCDIEETLINHSPKVFKCRLIAFLSSPLTLLSITFLHA